MEKITVSCAVQGGIGAVLSAHGEETEMENMSHVIQVIQGGIGAVLSVYGICLWFRNRGKRTLAVSCILSGAVLLGYAVCQII